MMHAELCAIICSGRETGESVHVSLSLEERVPRTRKLDREEALAELTRRYHQSWPGHGEGLLVVVWAHYA